jgi:hypothetical protein
LRSANSDLASVASTQQLRAGLRGEQLQRSRSRMHAERTRSCASHSQAIDGTLPPICAYAAHMDVRIRRLAIRVSLGDASKTRHLRSPVNSSAFIYGLSVIGRWALGDTSLERGWSSTIVIIAALGGANMLMTGVIGIYVGRIYAEAKGRPLYIIEHAVGFEEAPTAARRPATLG